MSNDHHRALRMRAVSYALDQHRHGPGVWRNLCQKFTRTALEAGPGAPSARAAWQSLEGTGKRRRWNPEHPPPMGVPVYFRLNTPFWHVALSAGKGYVWSTDILRPGHVDKVSIAYLERRWHAECLGWTTAINGKDVW